jgi:signal transduction histidine kinase
MLSISAVLIVVLSAIMIVNAYRLNVESDAKLGWLADNDGLISPDSNKNGLQNMHGFLGYEMTEETRFEMRFFVIKIDANLNLIQIDTSHIASVSADQAQQYALLAEGMAGTYGNIDNYSFLIADKPYGKLFVFLDVTSQIRTKSALLLTAAGISLIGLFIVFVLVSIFSKRAIKPVIESIQKQNRFITDAGHELKTPLTIIAANTDVLEYSAGENEWQTSIKNQTKRLEELVKNLLLLAKIDEGRSDIVFSDFSASDAVAEEAETFKTVASKKDIALRCDIPPGLTFYGDEPSIRHRTSILLDNAVKYADEATEVTVALTEHNKGIKLEVTNITKDMPSINMEKLFDRFFRVDSFAFQADRRNGIGLSIAKSITDIHKGKISAKRENNDTVRFTVIL